MHYFSVGKSDGYICGGGRVSHITKPPSLVPRPPLFFPFLCVHNNTRERKTSEKRPRSGSIHHVSGRKVDVGGGGGADIQIYTY